MLAILYICYANLIHLTLFSSLSFLAAFWIVLGSWYPPVIMILINYSFPFNEAFHGSFRCHLVACLPTLLSAIWSGTNAIVALSLSYICGYHTKFMVSIISELCQCWQAFSC